MNLILNPIILMPNTSTKKQVVFHEYVDKEEMEMYDIYFSDVWSCDIVGLEQKDGSVVVYKKGERFRSGCRNRKIFEEKYFVEAL